MVPAGNKAKCLWSVNRTIKTIHQFIIIFQVTPFFVCFPRLLEFILVLSSCFFLEVDVD